MFEIILLAYFSYRNNVRARAKGLNGVLWGILTAFSFITMLFIGSMVVIFGFYGDMINMDMLASTDPKVRADVSAQLVDMLGHNELHMLTIEVFGIGGYLLIRYILEKKPAKKNPQIHWMDKLEENNSSQQ